MINYLKQLFYGKVQDHSTYFLDPVDYKWEDSKIYKEICEVLDIKVAKYDLNKVAKLLEKERNYNNDFMDIKKKLNQNYIEEIIQNTRLSEYHNFIKNTIQIKETKLLDWIIIKDNAKNLNKGTRVRFKSRNNNNYYLLKKI